MTARKNYGLLIVLALMIAYSAYFSAYSIQLHNTFRTHASDMGQMDQALWNTLHGRILQDTRPNGQNLPRLTDHVEPIFLVLPIAFLIYDGIETLFVLQSIAIALGALPIFWIARRRLQSDWTGVAFAAMYLMYPALQAANLTEFHAITFAPAPLMFAFNYGEQRAWKRYVLFSLVALAVKEEVALLVFAMAVWFGIRNSKFKIQNSSARSRIANYELRITNYIPIAITAIALAWFLVAVFVIVPHFSPRGESVYVGRYTCASQAIRNPLTAIPDLVGCVLIPAKIEYVIELLASVGFLALLDPITLLVGAPSLVLNLLSSYAAQYSGAYHYSAPVAPYFVLAAIGGAARIQNSKFKIQNSLVIGLAFLIALGYHALAGYTPIGGAFVWHEVTEHQRTLSRFLKQIPPDARVSTTSSLFPHLSHREKLYRFPAILDAEYILLDVSQSNITNPVDYRENYQRALDQGFGIRDALDGYILLQRGVAQKQLPEGFYLFLRECNCALPQNVVTIDFENKVRLLGYDVLQDDWQRVYLRTYWARLSGLDNNFALFPFFPDEDGNPRADAQLPPLLVHFWYPTLQWRPDEAVIADTTPMDVGARAKIGVGVFFGATWDAPEFVLKPQTDLPISADGRWVLLGELVRDGKKYKVVK
ncbi:MAG: DUF2079 domain-containing protein [Chloroflexi bacterium]|nr:DUF2079 domain-containing protein [Chloroflexota bacterium]